MTADRCLIDTNALIWAFYAPSRLSATAAKTITSARELHVSIVTLWEIAMKFSRGGFRGTPIPEKWLESLLTAMEQQNYHILPVEPPDCRLIQDMPFHHKDPFDRMILAQCFNRRLAIISIDDVFEKYAARRIW